MPGATHHLGRRFTHLPNQDTEDVPNAGDFEAAEGGYDPILHFPCHCTPLNLSSGTEVFLDIFRNDQGSGYTVDSFRNSLCTIISLKEIFMRQPYFGSGNREKSWRRRQEIASRY